MAGVGVLTGVGVGVGSGVSPEHCDQRSITMAISTTTPIPMIFAGLCPGTLTMGYTGALMRTTPSFP